MTTVTEITSLDNLIDELYGSSAKDAARYAWEGAVLTVADKAKVTLPESTTRIDKAVAMVLSDAVKLLPDGKAQVASQTNGTTTYHLTNGTCDCQDFPRAPQSWCKHRLAAAIQKRAMAMLTPATPSQVPAADIPAQFLTTLHGKTFIQYAGLLNLAHARGLVSLHVKFLSVTDALALAECTATFADGHTYSECADATPGNVGTTVKNHFARMALTRAKARCLRDALNIAMCSLEEVE